MTKEGTMRGRIMDLILLIPVAPSIEAASRTSWLRPVKPAIYMSIIYPASCHTVTRINAKYAVLGALSIDFESHSAPRDLPMAVNTFEKMNFQMKPSTTPPIRFGVKKPARKKF